MKFKPQYDIRRTEIHMYRTINHHTDTERKGERDCFMKLFQKTKFSQPEHNLNNTRHL